MSLLAKLPKNLTPTSKRRLGIGAAAVVGTAVVVGGLGALVAPSYVKPMLETELSTALGRKVTVGGLGINLLNLSATVRDVTIFEANQKDTAVHVGELYANVALASLWHRAPVIQQIRISQPTVNVVRTGAERFNHSDIVDKFAQAPQTPPPKDAEPARFSLNNIQIEGGEIHYSDQVAGSQHTIAALNIAIPFVSNLPYAAEIFTEPAVTAKVDGAPFLLKGKTLPFAGSHQTALNLDVDGLVLTKYLPFVQLPFPIRIQNGLLDTRLTLQFAQTGGQQKVLLGGTAALRQFELQEKQGAPLVSWGALNLSLDNMEPLRQRFTLKSLQLSEPKVYVHRLANGKLNWQEALKSTAPATKSATPAAAPAQQAKDPVLVALGHAEIVNGKVLYEDDALKTGKIHYAVQRVDASIDGLNTQAPQPAPFHIKAQTEQGEQVEHTGKLALAQQQVAGTINLKNFQPQLARPYFASVFAAQLGTTLVDAVLPYQVSWRNNDFQFALKDASARLHAVQLLLPREQQASFSAQEISADGIHVDSQPQTASVANFTLKQPSLSVKRDAQGQINLLKALPPATAQTAPPKHRHAATAPSRPWQAKLAHFRIEDATINFSDAQPAAQNGGKPALQNLKAVHLALDNLAWPVNASTPASNVDVSLLHNGSGRLHTKGQFKLQPLSTQLTLNIRNLDLTAAQPYFTQYTNAYLTRGTASAQGRLNLQLPDNLPPQVSYVGNLSLANLRTQDKLSKDDFVRWKGLNLSQINLQQNTQSPPTAVHVGQVTLADFFAKIIVRKDGRLNLQDILAQPTSTGDIAKPVSLTATQATSSPVASAPASSSPTTAPTTVASAASAASVTTPAPLIRLGGVALQRGQVNFSDNFIQPNYRANLRDVSGTISKVASDNPDPATVKVTAKLDGDAPVTIGGRVNPLSPQLFLDMTAKAEGIELTRFTPYSSKYAGYPITKGKLTVDVKYLVENGKLKAENGIFIDQLTFGEKVDSPHATNLPVMLAVSLLKNSRGEIDIHLPVSGSLSDPDFSYGGLIVQVLVNLLTKAVIAPFSLLSGHGGTDLGYIDFASGEATLSTAALNKLGDVAKMLQEKPSLKLEIIGRLDAAQDNLGLQKAYVNRKIKLIKQKQSTADTEQITIAPEERAALMAQAYRAESFDKPRNALGLTKSLSTEEMEKLMMMHAPVDETTLKQLAERRAFAIKKALVELHKMPSERLFLLAPQPSESIPGGKVNQPRVDFSLK